MPNIGPMELVIVLAIALLVLGPKRLPDAGKSLGKGIREFKEGISGSSKDDTADSLESAVKSYSQTQPTATKEPTA